MMMIMVLMMIISIMIDNDVDDGDNHCLYDDLMILMMI